ncbi:MAG TPA: hypothetical protein VER11_29380 [Polyangiaceae bacterium]|nr:hypothetical protein [Polyangiaceae bacterium]
MTHKTLRLTIPFVLLAAIACKKQDEPAATAGYQVGTPGAAGAPAAVPPPAPSATAPVVPPPAPSSSAPVPVDPALSAAVAPLLTQLGASQTVAGSKPLGSAMVGNVGGAQNLEQQIMLQPNKCYTVVAAGMPPISELNVQFLAVTIIPGMAPVLAVDQDTGPSATLGKKPNCYKWALPLPAAVKVVVSAAGGQGVAGAQVYEK